MTKEAASCDFVPGNQTSKPVISIDIDEKFSTGELSVIPNRYHLVWGSFCPWATPVSIEIDLLGLDKVISKTNVHPLRKNGRATDWYFNADETPDPILKTVSLSDNYVLTNPEFVGRASVPSLIDLNSGKVVNNNFDTLLNEFPTAWIQYTNGFDLYPDNERVDIDELNNLIETELTQVPGKITQAKSQAEYVALVKTFFNRLGQFEQILAQSQFVLGDQLRQTDLRLFSTLVRFDIAYYYQNKLSAHKLTDYPNLWRYAKELYQIPAFKKNTDFDAIIKHFYQNDDSEVNTFERVVPVGIDTAKWELK